MAPQWLLPRTAATATFMVRARSIARRIANVAPICPMLLPPSTRMAAAASRATRGRPRGSILPSRSRSAYSGTRSTPWEWTPWRSAVTSVSPSKAASSADIPHAAKMPVTTACSRSGGIRRSRSAPGYALTRRSKRDDAARLHAHAEEDDRPGGAGIPETFRLGELELLLRHAGPGRAEVQERRPAGPGPDDHLARHPLRALVAADDTDEPERPRLAEEGGEAAGDPRRRLLERGDHGRVVRGPGALAFVPVDLDRGAALGQRRAQQDVVDPEPPVPVKRAGPVVPPRVETSLLGPVDPERVGQPPGEERAEGAPLGLARHDVTAPLLGIPDVAILGRDIEVAADDDVLAGVDLALQEGQEPAVPAELVGVPGRAQLAAVGRVDVHDARAAARGDEEPARGVQSVAGQRADHLRAR